MPDNFTSNTELFTVATQIHNGNSKVNVIDKNRQIIKQIPISPVLDVQVSDINSNDFLDIVYTYKNSFNKYSVFIIPDFHLYNSEKIEWPLRKHDLGMTCNYDYQDNNVPVELTTFTASVLQNEKAVQLNWTTATEINNSGFEILRGVYPERNQRTQNDNEWKTIGFVPGFGTTTEPKSYSFIDDNVTTRVYKYRLKQIDFDGSFEYSNEIDVEVDFTPEEFVLYQNYPNPFNSSTLIEFTLPDDVSNATLSIYNALGMKVTELVNRSLTAGKYSYQFNSIDLSAGFYIYELRADNFISAKKMLLLK
jgi:hypothetical protein